LTYVGSIVVVTFLLVYRIGMSLGESQPGTHGQVPM